MGDMMKHKITLIVLTILIVILAGCTTQQVPVEEEPISEVVVDMENDVQDMESDVEALENDIVEEEEIETPEEIVEDVEEAMLNDGVESLFDYRERTYYYDNGFGVADIDYEGDLPYMESGEKFTLRIHDTLGDSIDIDVNHKSDEYESTGELFVGDSYVTKQGIKITIKEILGNKIKFTLEKVSPSEWTNHCADCYKTGSRADDGMRYVNSDEDTLHTYEGEQYAVRVMTSQEQARLKFNSRILPVLQTGDEYILESGAAIKYIFGVKHQLADRPYGYAGFGFVESIELPDVVICPQCHDFIYSGTTMYSYGRDSYDVEFEGTKFYFDGSLVELSDDFVILNSDLEAKKVSSDKVGLKFTKDAEPVVYCKEDDDENGPDYSTKGKIKITLRDNDQSFYREDICVDSNILVEYSCEHVSGRTGANGKGWTGVMEYKQCPCSDGACVE